MIKMTPMIGRKENRGGLENKYVALKCKYRESLRDQDYLRDKIEFQKTEIERVKKKIDGLWALLVISIEGFPMSDAIDTTETTYSGEWT